MSRFPQGCCRWAIDIGMETKLNTACDEVRGWGGGGCCGVGECLVGSVNGQDMLSGVRSVQCK